MVRRFNYESGVRRRRNKMIVGVLLSFIIVGLIGGGIAWFWSTLQPANPSDQTLTRFVIETGENEKIIGDKLQDQGLVRSSFSFQLYARVTGARGSFQAGGYEVSPSMSVHDIIERMVEGEVVNDLVTILPAQRLDQIRQAFLDKGFTESEIDEALDPNQYVGHPALIDKPFEASLEGYLYPESFLFNDNTSLTEVVKGSLNELATALTPQLKAKFEDRGLDVHQAIILASIVEREVSEPNDKPIVAQVFLTRYSIGMPLGSDPTALYGALQAGLEPSVFADTPYNTRIYTGLPPGPINNVSESSLNAVANPADTDYLYFVSGDDGKTYFSRTLAEHEALTAEHCQVLCNSY